MTLNNGALQSEITGLLSRSPVVLFMKGNRQAPRCGFSAQVVEILDDLLPNYETVDVLSNPQLREGIKQFSDWPTIPQLYINGNFVGGCDIVREMSSSGELQKLLGVQASSQPLPTVSISESAIRAIAAAAGDADEDLLHLQVPPNFEHDLYFGPRLAGEIEIHTNGPVLLLDKSSARRAEGIHIDYLEGESSGFSITNPNAPPSVKPIGAQELKALLDRNAIELFDVRPEDERRIASIARARPLNGGGQEFLQSLDRDAPIALHCHHGSRSHAAAQQLVQNGFRNVYNLSGGIDAWSQTVDATVPRY